jgi:hypothetical protein
MKSLAPSLLLAAFTFVTVVHAQTPQSPTDPPPSQKAILTTTGKGVQIYACQQASGTPQWVFQAPEATLTDASGKTVATHAAGPIWRSQDGSTVKGEVVAKNASPEATAIPWLLLKPTTTTGSGIMNRVEFIRRSDTHGGNAPVAGCGVEHLNTTIRVPYSAVYTFYSAKP